MSNVIFDIRHNGLCLTVAGCHKSLLVLAVIKVYYNKGLYLGIKMILKNTDRNLTIALLYVGVLQIKHTNIKMLKLL